MVVCQCDQSKGQRMGSSSNIILRSSIVLGMSAAVVTILYFTPMPDQNFKSCDRPCHELDWPMICRVKLNIEMYQTTSSVCQDCDNNSLSERCDDFFCRLKDKSSRGVVTTNKHFPAPAIHVCQNDILVVDVINRIPGHNLAIHWRGQPNHEAPFMDGVPMVTQCPIPSYTTFQYKFRASAAGTHFYHAHGDTDRVDGLFGALIVRQADKVEPHRKLYDVDSKDHVLLISDWSGHHSLVSPSSNLSRYLLVNGRGPSDSLNGMTVFRVERGKRYRLRMVYGAGVEGCPLNVSVDGHVLRVIALDGNPVRPLEVAVIELSKGERADFVLKAGQEKGIYYVRINSNCANVKLQGLAVIQYENSNQHKQEEQNLPEVRSLSTSLSCRRDINKVCMADLKSFSKIPLELLGEKMDRKIYLKIEGKDSEKATVYGTSDKVYRLNNFTFTYPPSPLLTQMEDVPKYMLCSEDNVPERCKHEQGMCECVYMEQIDLGTTIEVVLINTDTEEHVFHLHGHQFYIVSYKLFGNSTDIQETLEADNYSFEYLKHPIKKDTIRVPVFGIVAFRFHANNPGFWMLRDEMSKKWTRGLDMVFQVGERNDMVATPSNFPTCGNYIGPDFFLL